MRTIRGDSIGPFFQGPRLQGTPDDGPDEEDDSSRQCYLCMETFAADELTECRGRSYCEECLDAEREAEKRRAKAEAMELQADYDIEMRKDKEG